MGHDSADGESDYGSDDTPDVGLIAGIAAGVVVVIVVIVILVVVVHKRNTIRQPEPPSHPGQNAPSIMQPHDFSEQPEPPSFMQPVVAEPVGDGDAVDPNPVMATPVVASDVSLSPALAVPVDPAYDAY